MFSPYIFVFALSNQLKPWQKRNPRNPHGFWDFEVYTVKSALAELRSSARRLEAVLLESLSDILPEFSHL